MAEVILFRSTKGINNRVDPVRLKWDTDPRSPNAGVVELAAAVNVDIDQTGAIRRRGGRTRLTSLAQPHSLWSNGGLCFVVSEDTLYQVNSDYSVRPLVSGLTIGARMAFAWFAGSVFWMNGKQCGIISPQGVNIPWQATKYVGPDTIYEISFTPPLGTILEVMSGYLLIVQGPILWFCMQFAPLYWRMSRDFLLFPTDLAMVQAVEDGVWISDSKSAYWLAGHDPNQWLLQPKSGFAAYPNPAIPGTAVGTQGSIIGERQFQGRVAIWTGPKGICVGAAGGQFANLTERKLVYPPGLSGAAIVMDDNRYVVMIDS
ncbi:MAG: hypothetical protein ACLQBD_01110 [Syntrophobacteraceae bacterium]